jgi:hypothetical protein
MKTHRTKIGPFSERPYYSLEEVEQICTDELRKVGLFPEEPEPIRIDRFIEKRFKVDPRYEELPEGLLGCTKFGPKGMQEMIISRSLSEENNKVSERRVNTTLAHESGHGLLHAHLFALEHKARSLFGDGLDPKELKILCRKDTVDGIQERKGANRPAPWWEYQANLAIGGLLMPRQLVMITLEPHLTEKGRLGNRALDAAQKEKATRELVEVFDVNPIVARIRIDTIFPRSQENQLWL